MERAANESPKPQRCEETAQWAVSHTLDDIPAEKLSYLKTLVLDTLGCAIAALDGEPIIPIRRLTAELGGSAQCTPIGGRRTEADRAALWNSSLVRYLDFMDTASTPPTTSAPRSPRQSSCARQARTS